MLDKDNLQKLTQTILSKLPGDLNLVKDDFQQCLKSSIQSTLNEFNLVSKEEFDSQAKVLANAQAKLETLSKKLNELEQKLG